MSAGDVGSHLFVLAKICEFPSFIVVLTWSVFSAAQRVAVRGFILLAVIGEARWESKRRRLIARRRYEEAANNPRLPPPT